MFNSLPMAGQRGFEPWLPTLEPFASIQYDVLLLSPSWEGGVVLPCLPAIVLQPECHANRIDLDGGLGDHLVEPPGITFEGTVVLVEVK